MESRDSVEDWESLGAQDYNALLTAVFGESDTDEDSKDQQCSEEKVDIESDEEWEKVKEVEGLWHCGNFLPIKQQLSLLEAIESEGWFCDPLHNQAMRFGDLPGWAKDLSILIQMSGGQRRLEGLEPQNSDEYSEIDDFGHSPSPFPSRILEREPLFDQMIVNMYQPGEGIAAHVDLLRFEDGIAIVSLESACVMTFRPVNNSFNGVEDTCTNEPILDLHRDSSPGYGNFANTKEMPRSRSLVWKELEASRESPQARRHKSCHTCEVDPSSGAAKRVDVLLNPGDLIIAYGPARYDWTHEINRGKGNQLWKGQPIVQQRRISVTLRRLCFQNDVS